MAAHSVIRPMGRSGPAHQLIVTLFCNSFQTALAPNPVFICTRQYTLHAIPAWCVLYHLLQHADQSRSLFDGVLGYLLADGGERQLHSRRLIDRQAAILGLLNSLDHYLMQRTLADDVGLDARLAGDGGIK